MTEPTTWPVIAGVSAYFCADQDLYDMVDENLRQHDPRHPTADPLRAVAYQGLTGIYGKSAGHNTGAGEDSEASEAMINIADEPDARPVWFCVWGDCANIAQAICKVQNTCSASELSFSPTARTRVRSGPCWFISLVGLLVKLAERGGFEPPIRVLAV